MRRTESGGKNEQRFLFPAPLVGSGPTEVGDADIKRPHPVDAARNLLNAFGRGGRPLRIVGGLYWKEMIELMIEMAELLERITKGEQVNPEEARSIKNRLQKILEGFRAPLKQTPTAPADE